MQGMIRIYGSPNIPENLFILIAQKKYRVSFVFEKPFLDVLLMMMDLSRNLYSTASVPSLRC